MKRQSFAKRVVALLLMLCFMGTMLLGIVPGTARAAEEQDYIYFLNSNGWETVGAYIYGNQGELLGSWGTTTATAATELGGSWMKVAVSALPPYSIIFYNTADPDNQRAELYINAADKIYVAGCKADGNAAAYTSQAAAEEAIGTAGESYPVYFLNTEGWETVGAYIYGDQGELLGSWGTTTATAATELGEKWVQVDVSAAPPYNIIFFNTADPDNQRAELLLDAAEKIYVTADAEAFTTQQEAEEAMGIASYPVYFLNTEGWETVGAYIYGDQGELLGSWGTTTATAATELGEKWVQVDVSAAPPYNIIFFNTADPDNQRAELLLDAAEKIYVTADAQAYTSQADAEAAMGIASYPVYFLNTEGWETVGAYIYGDQGELLGSWGTTTATAATELGGDWVQVKVPAEPPYNIIFFNTADPDNQRAELLLDAAEKIYVTADAQAYTSQADAEASMGIEPPAPSYPVYFLNSNGWESVGAYAYYQNEAGENVEPLGTWGTTTATAATELGGSWVQVSAAQEPPYSVIFYNTADDTQRVELYLDAAGKIYVTVNAAAFTTQADAEASLNTEEPPAPTGYPVYFLNSEQWETVGAYIYGDQGELLGSWGTTTATAATELGGDWMQVDVSAAPPYNIIFFNTADDTQRAELLLDAADKIYVTVKAQAYTSSAAAENSLVSTGDYTLYFLNSNKWTTVGAYIYGDQGELLGGWGNTTAAAATELGGNWVKVNVTAAPPYNVIFYNTADPDAQRTELFIDASNKIYVTVKAQAYTSQKEAEYALYASDRYTLYFLNSQKWSSVGAYIYGDQGELLGSWGTTTATTAWDLGGDWKKVGVPELPPYSIIFYNKADDTQRVELFIDASDKIYVTTRAQAFTTQEAAEKSLASAGKYTLYFLNDKQWQTVGAYIYGDQGELLGSWGSTMTEPAPELGENWLKVSVPALPPYSVIFYDTADETQRAELLIDAADKLYINSRSQAFTSAEAAENAQATVGDYTLYFLNTSKWETVGAYIYGEQGTLLGSWGATVTEPAPELGEDWVKVAVTALPPYSVIFYNTADETQRAELFIDSSDKIYVAANAVAYNTKQKAEAAMGVTIQIDPNNRDYGPGVQAIAEMTGSETGTGTQDGSLWVILVSAGVLVLVLAVLLLIVAKKIKSVSKS